jgi:Phosphotransferase enzyme family
VDDFAGAVRAAEQALGGIAIRAAPHPYRTSHELVDVDVMRANGFVSPVVVKQTARPIAQRPRFMQQPTLEADVYRRLLSPHRPWAPRFVAASSTHLVLERVDAKPLWQFKLPEIAAALGTELRTAHDELAQHAGAPFLMRHDSRYYERWFRRACLLEPGLRRLQHAHATAVPRLAAERRTVIHGELYPSNVLVRGARICFVDWELAAAGPAVIDVAAATSGWDAEQIEIFLASYGSVDRLALAGARLHLAFRRLGWSARWSPPPEHDRDWRQEAFDVASALTKGTAA